MPLYNRDKNYYSESNADGTATGTTLITQTSDSGEYNYQPFEVFAQVTQEQNVLTPAVVSVGTNDPDYNDIVSAQAIGGVVGCVRLQVVGDLPQIGPETDIKVKVNTACIPVIATTPTQLFKVIIRGMEM